MTKATINALRSRIRALRVQLSTAQRHGDGRQAELVADAIEADEAKLAKLLGKSAKRK